MSSLYSFIINLMKYIGGAIVIAGLFVVPFLLGPMIPMSRPLSPDTLNPPGPGTRHCELSHPGRGCPGNTCRKTQATRD